MEASFNPAGGLETVAQDLLVLDVTEKMPNIENADELCRGLLEDLTTRGLGAALERFSGIE